MLEWFWIRQYAISNPRDHSHMRVPSRSGYCSEEKEKDEMNPSTKAATIASAALYHEGCVPPTVEIARKRIADLKNIIILLDTEMKVAQRRAFNDDIAFQNYLTERTNGIVVCKIERKFLFDFVDEREPERLIARRMETLLIQKKMEFKELFPAVAKDVEALSSRARAVLSVGIDSPEILDTREQATSRRAKLTEQKRAIGDIFLALSVLRGTHCSFPFAERSMLNDRMYQIDRELGIVGRTMAVLAGTPKCDRSTLKLSITLTDAVMFLLNLVEQNPPDLSLNPMAKETLEEIRSWSAGRTKARGG